MPIIRNVQPGAPLPLRAPEGGSAIRVPSLDGPDKAGAGDDTGFAGVLGRALSEAGASERAADDAAVRFAAGDPEVGIHEVVIAAEKANIGVRFAVTLKNRAIEAYRELMNTQV